MRPRLPDSGAATDAQGRRHAPSTARNAGPILDVLRQVLPAEGRMLELASGTGQHARVFTDALPGWHWQPSDLDPGNLASIRAWAEGQPRIAAPLVLDAARPGWQVGRWDAVLLVNLLHLIAEPAAETVLAGICAAADRAVIYGPFLRAGRATSPGDAAFDADLRAHGAGYKDLGWVVAALSRHGFATRLYEMPANNLALHTFKI